MKSEIVSMNAALFLPAQQKETNVRQVKARKKQSHTNLIYVSYIFIIYGLDLDLYDKKSRFKCMMLHFMKLFNIFFNMYVLVLVMFMLFKLNYQIVYEPKLFISTFVLNLSGNVSWFVINKFKEKISYLFQKMKKQETNFQMENSTFLNAFTILWPITMQLIYFYVQIFPISESKYNESINVYFFNFINSSKCDCYYLYYGITFIFIGFSSTLISCTILLYILICIHFEKVLLTFSVKNTEINFSKRVSHNSVLSRFYIYDSILNTMKLFESTMTIPIFICFFSSSFDAFYGMLLLIKRFNKASLFNDLVIVVRGLISFCLISYMAGSVNQADRIAKDSNALILRNNFPVSKLTKLDSKMNLLHENNKPPFALTAWGFFEFKRNFFLSAIGSLLTYTLLFINI